MLLMRQHPSILDAKADPEKVTTLLSRLQTRMDALHERATTFKNYQKHFKVSSNSFIQNDILSGMSIGRCCTVDRAVLTVLWIGFCHTGPISLCVDLFVFVCICVFFVSYCIVVVSL